jgi:hypothetical protein
METECMLKIGDRTQYGKVIAVLWTGERYYSFDQGGVVCLVPGVLADQDMPDDPMKCVYSDVS